MDLESMAKKLMTGKDGAAIEKLAAGFDGSAAEDAVRRGDEERMKAVLRDVLATPEGRALAAKVREAMNGNGR